MSGGGAGPFETFGGFDAFAGFSKVAGRMQACGTQVGVERSMDLAWDIQTPDKLPPRSGITAVAADAQSAFAPGASIARL